jgi:hypothetical protein
MADYMNTAIRMLQDIMDSVDDSGFMVRQDSFAAGIGATSTLTEAEMVAGSASLTSGELRDMREVWVILGGTSSTYYDEIPIGVLARTVVRAKSGIWFDGNINWAWDEDERILRFTNNIDVSSNQLSIRYSFHHTLLTSGNISSQDVEMTPSAYPIIELLTALLAVTKHPREIGRAQHLLALLGMQKLPGRAMMFGDTAQFEKLATQIIGDRN